MGDPERGDPEDLDDGARSPESAEEGPGTDMGKTLNKEQLGGRRAEGGIFFNYLFVYVG